MNNNYYPFGMLQPDMYAENEDPRTRFGFNGMLRDDDIKDKFSTSPDDEGRGNSYATHFRMYDPRVARWFSIDPLVAQFPWTSPYTAMGNNSVSRIDPMGDDDYKFDTDGSIIDVEKTESDDRFFLDDDKIDIYDSDIGSLSRIIYAEARGEPSEGKDLVGQVVKNRVESKRFPDTYNEVIEQKAQIKSGITVYQFTSVNPEDKNNYNAYINPFIKEGNVKKAGPGFIESLQSAIKTVNDKNMIVGSETLLYYSPKSMKPAYSIPKWNFKLLEETTPESVDSKSFRSYKYK